MCDNRLQRLSVCSPVYDVARARQSRKEDALATSVRNRMKGEGKINEILMNSPVKGNLKQMTDDIKRIEDVLSRFEDAKSHKQAEMKGK